MSANPRMLLHRGAKLDKERARGLFKETIAKQTLYLPFESIQLAAKKDNAADDGYITVEGWASKSSTINCYGFSIASNAWKAKGALDRFQRNPQVFFNHKRDWNVGIGDATEPKDEGLWCVLRISRAAMLPTGEQIGKLIEDGRLRTFSVGIDITDYDLVETPDTILVVVTGVILSEISVVTLPGDDEAIFSVKQSLGEIVKLSAGENAPNFGGRKMDLKLLAKSLGLPETAGEGEVMLALNALLQRAQEGPALRRQLGLPETASPADVLAALTQRTDPTRLAALETENKTLKASALLSKYASKVAPALKEWALDYATKDPEGFEKWAQLAQDAVPLGDVVNPSTQTQATQPAQQSAGLSGMSVLEVARQNSEGNLGFRAQDAQLGDMGIAKGLALLSGGNGKPYITREDQQICLMFGHFDKVEDMAALADTSPATALSWVFGGRKFKLTHADQLTLRKREILDRIGLMRPNEYA